MRASVYISLLCSLIYAVASIPAGPPPRNAVCHVKPDATSTQSVTGIIIFNQTSQNSPLRITVNLVGFNPVQSYSPETNFLHGFHIHEFGDVSRSCSDAAGHYNPRGVNHGAKNDRIRHVGDLGNIRQQPDGTITELIIEDKIATLYGVYSIMGRAMVVHANADDLGKGGNPQSLITGNAGARLACCSIVYSP